MRSVDHLLAQIPTVICPVEPSAAIDGSPTNRLRDLLESVNEWRLVIETTNHKNSVVGLRGLGNHLEHVFLSQGVAPVDIGSPVGLRVEIVFGDFVRIPSGATFLLAKLQRHVDFQIPISRRCHDSFQDAGLLVTDLLPNDRNVFGDDYLSNFVRKALLLVRMQHGIKRRILGWIKLQFMVTSKDQDAPAPDHV